MVIKWFLFSAPANALAKLGCFIRKSQIDAIWPSDAVTMSKPD